MNKVDYPSIDDIKFDADGLVPAIIQDSRTRVVLMQAFMNRDSFQRTVTEGKVCFYSRSRQCLWTKGEESGNFLFVERILADCDNDSLLIKVIPAGVVCHTGNDTCWNERNEESDFLYTLERYLQKRRLDSPQESYTARLLSEGLNRVTQKVGEEAVETVIAALNQQDDLFLNEAADLMYHYLVLLMAKGYQLDDVTEILRLRHK